MSLFTKEEIAECSHCELLKIYCHAITASWKWVTANELVEKEGGVISYVILTANTQNTVVTLHDGVDANAEVIATLKTTTAQSRPYAFHNHLKFKKGLYVVVDDNTLGVLVVWHPFPFGVLKS